MGAFTRKKEKKGQAKPFTHKRVGKEKNRAQALGLSPTARFKVKV